MEDLRIMGIDPGYDRCGVSIIEGKINSPKLIFSCCLETSKNKSFPERIEFIYNSLIKIIEEFKPNIGSIEDIFFTTNQKTAVKVSEARGVCLLAMQKKKLKIHEFTPLQVKTSLTSYGKAEKKQVYFIVEKILKNSLNQKNKSKIHDDEMDAIAIALTSLYNHR